MEKNYLGHGYLIGNAALEKAKDAMNPNYIGISPLVTGDVCVVSDFAIAPDYTICFVLIVTRHNVGTFDKIISVDDMVNPNKDIYGAPIGRGNHGDVVDTIKKQARYVDAYESLRGHKFRVVESGLMRDDNGDERPFFGFEFIE